MRKLLNRACRMRQTFCFYISLMCFFRGVKPSYKPLYPICANSRTPSFTAFKFRHAQKTTCFVSFVRLFLILNILSGGNISKIAKRVIAWVAINMVNVAQRPITSHVKPRQSTSSISSFVDANNCVSFGPYVSRDCSRYNLAACFDAPSKMSSFWLVMQQFMQLFKCDVKMVHVTSLS